MADFDSRGITSTGRAAGQLGHDHRGAIGAPTVIVTQILSLRPPQFGIPLAAREAFLVQQLPNGIPSFIALYSTMPDRAGVGGVEAVGSGYARVSHSNWRGLVVGGFIARRTNVGDVVFAALTGDLTVVGWGAYDAAVDGELLAFGLLRNADGKARTFDLATGDDPTFLNGELQVGIQ